MQVSAHAKHRRRPCDRAVSPADTRKLRHQLTGICSLHNQSGGFPTLRVAGAFETATRPCQRSDHPFDHHLLDLGDCLGRVQPFGAGLGTVHDGVTTIELERVMQIIQPLARGLVAAVDQPAIGM